MHKIVSGLAALVVVLGMTQCTRRTASTERFLNFNVSAEPEYLDPGMMSGDT